MWTASSQTPLHCPSCKHQIFFLVCRILFHKCLLSWLTFCFANPGSITNTTPSIVREVSAIFVDTTTFRPMAPLGLLGGAGSKIRCWRFGGSVEYRGMHFSSPTSGPRLSISLFILLQASSISWRLKQYMVGNIIYIPGYEENMSVTCLNTNLLACEEQQDISSNFFTHVNLNYSSNGSFKVVPFWLWCVENFDRMGSTRHIHQWCIVKILLQAKIYI